MTNQKLQMQLVMDPSNMKELNRRQFYESAH